MDRVKTFIKYALWIVAFAVFSEILINVGLNSTYREMEKTGNIPEQVTINQAESTSVNQRIRGTITNSGDEDLNGKYMKMDFYSERGVFLGEKYIPIQNVNKGETTDFEIFSKLQNAKSYVVSIVDEKKVGTLGEIEILPKEWTKPEIVWATLLTILIFW